MKIEGYFKNLKIANIAVYEMKKNGLGKAVVDINEHYINNRNSHMSSPGTEGASSLSALVMKSGNQFVDSNKAPLAAASPMVSGMGGFEEVADYNVKVIVETEESQEKVENFIREAGGVLENPNAEIPKRLEDIDI